MSKPLLHSVSPAVARAVCFAACLIAAGGCWSGQRSGLAVRLQGAGSTFVNPLFQKWLFEYAEIKPNYRIDYQSIGSGGGIKQLRSRTVDFGATDVPMSDEDMRSSPAEVIHVPTVLGSVVLTYNLKGVAVPLRFSPEVIAGIFLEEIKRWDDPRLRADNPGVELPAADIVVVHRSDGSGTTAIFTDYLSKVSAEWKRRVGSNTSVSWPTGLGGKGNEGVSGQVKQTPHAIGYVERAFAWQNKLPIALVRNRAGNYVEPSLDAITAAAAESVATTPDDLRVSITDASGATAYPISSYVYALIYKDQRDAAKGRALVEFLSWGLHEGQDYAKRLEYSPLPAEIVRRAETKLNEVEIAGRPLRSTTAAMTTAAQMNLVRE